MNHIKALTTCVASFVDELASMGVEQAVVSPGSRSTPLTMLFNEHPEINVFMNIDERSAGFFALGMAKATQKPTALICTSGTAAANYFPSLIEAKLSRVPLIVITSDRPHELRNVGAPQAIDQIKMFGDHVKSFIEMPVPDDTGETAKLFRSQARRAVMTSKAAPYGPVHMNLPFREPLVTDLKQKNLWEENRLPVPFKSTYGESHLSDQDADSLMHVVRTMRRGLIIVGPQTDERLAPLLAEFSRRMGIPVLADPLSQLRTGNHDKEWVMDTYDAMLREASLRDNMVPDVIIRMGPMPVSKPLLKYINQSKADHYILIDSGKEWLDPTHKLTEMVYADPVSALQQLLMANAISSDQQRNWGESWKKFNLKARNRIASELRVPEWYEGPVVSNLVKELPDNAILFAGNSMPIRDLDTFLINQDKKLITVGNRGANGIDGITSTALGVSAVKKNTYLLIGDLSFIHDMNGLLSAKLYRTDITIIVVNNNGGGIFSFLPQADSVESFDKLFATPADLDISLIAKLYEAAYFVAESWQAYKEAINASACMRGLKIIEVKTNRELNAKHHRNLWERISQDIKDV